MEISELGEWRTLLASSGGRNDVHDRGLALIHKMAREKPSDGEQDLAAAAKPLAAVTVLRGPTAASEFLNALAEPMEFALEYLIDNAPARSELVLIGLLGTIAIGEASGLTFELDGFDPRRALDTVAVSKNLSAADRVAVALIALGLDEPDYARLLVGRGAPSSAALSAGDPAALVKTLDAALNAPAQNRAASDAAWEAFLCHFPALLADGKADFLHLLLAARIVLGKLGGTPPGDVAQALHRRVVELAAAPA